MSIIETPLKGLEVPIETLHDLLLMIQEGAYAFEWANDRTVWIGKGKSIGAGIIRNLGEFFVGDPNSVGCREGVYKQSPSYPFKVRILGGAADAVYIKLWQAYKKEGYKILSRTPSIWRVVELPISDPRPGQDGFLVALYYINQSGRRTLASVFETVAEARTWVQEKLGGVREVLEPVYMDSNLTRSVRKYLRDVV